MHEIISKLDLGDIHYARDKEQLLKANITHILVATNTVGILHPNVTSTSFQDFKYKVFPVNDMVQENLLLHLPKGVEFIHRCLQSGGSILVHWYVSLTSTAMQACRAARLL